MPRNGSGSYSLPQPSFVPGTTISSAAVNSDLTDIAAALTGSISSDGQTPITAPLKGEAGNIAAPAWSFNGDGSSGMFLSAVGEVALSAGGIFGLKATSVAFTATAAVPAAGGTGYAVGDTITLTGGTVLRPVVLTVTSLSGSAVASAAVTDAGLYTVAPTNPVSQGSTSGSGTGATFTLTFGGANAVSDLTGNALWTLLGASSYMSTAMQQTSGAALANYIGAAALATAIQASLPIPTPHVRLSLASLTPVLNSDVVGSSTVFVMPYGGNLVPIWNGSIFVCQEFSQLTVTLTTSHLANTIYDVFMFMDGTTVTVGTGPAWSNSGSGSSLRGTGAFSTQLALLNGLYVNAVQCSMRNGASAYTVDANKATYLGSLLIDSTAGQASAYLSYGQSRKFGVWNAYNRVPIALSAGTSVVNWNVVGALPLRPANADVNNCAFAFQGLAEETISIARQMAAGTTSSTQNGTYMIAAIGYNSTSALSGTGGHAVLPLQGVITGTPAAHYDAPPALGLNTLTMLEAFPNGTSGLTASVYGTQYYNCLYARYRG